MILSSDRPVERVMDTAFTKIRALVDADTVVGKPIETVDGASIIPISKLTLGFLTGGGEYSDSMRQNPEYPFAGGSGVGVSVTPIGFLVSEGSSVKIIRMDDKNPFDKILGLIPELTESVITASKKGKK